MTSTTTQSATTSVITARDFSPSTTDPQRDTWTVGKLYHVVKALAGRPVAITTDNSTGHTEFNVILKGAHYGSSQILRVNYDYGTGEQDTDYRVWTIGMIMVMPTGGRESAKWDALASYRNHCSAAIEIAQQLHGADRRWGTWKAEPIDGYRVNVTYTPSTGNPAFADRCGTRGIWKIHVGG